MVIQILVQSNPGVRCPVFWMSSAHVAAGHYYRKYFMMTKTLRKKIFLLQDLLFDNGRIFCQERSCGLQAMTFFPPGVSLWPFQHTDALSFAPLGSKHESNHAAQKQCCNCCERSQLVSKLPVLQCYVLSRIPYFSECINGQIWKRARFKISGLENHLLGKRRHFLQLKTIDGLSYGRHISDTRQNLNIYPTISAACNSLQGRVLFNIAPEKRYCLSKEIIQIMS